MTAALCVIFLLSGAAALVFETLWFRQAGLALGNTVWASSLVTASFMAGLAVGNAAVARWGRWITRPLPAYAVLEVVVGLSGVALVAAFPLVGHALAPLMGSLDAGALHALRVAVSFVLLLLPSCAMGATLPLLAGALTAADPNFGRVLGRLYGWNTLGAVLGTLAADLLLIEAVGVRGTSLVAAGLNLAAAAGAFLLARRHGGRTAVEAAPVARLPKAGRRPLAAAFLAGGVLLALEVVWFRFLLSFTPASAWTFAVMLAVVLFGIGAGGLAASALLGRWPEGHRWTPLAPLTSGALVVVTYGSFLWLAPPAGATEATTIVGYFGLALPLMLPVCLLSGLFFTFVGRAVFDACGEATRAAGLLTLANTVGAMAGALAAGFLLLPRLGVEKSLFLVAGLYGVVALLAWPPRSSRRELSFLVPAAALLLAALALFPFDLMERQYVPRIAARWKDQSARPVAYEEGLTETVMLLRSEFLGRPASHRLVTNGLAMSATSFVARRYMGLYAWWPVAVHPRPRRALLISYGLGTTARALVETRELETIDVVDTSADVLRVSALAQESPAADPLRDPRVHAHVEDGRFFLLTSRATYDIITAEPPPPKAAGIASLYSREYFGLARSRLAPGGIVTYWLPVGQMEAREMRAVVGAFCAVFEDCSLWAGYGLEWMLAGTRGAQGPVSLERFTAQWRDPVVAARLEESGLDGPPQLGALFLADAPALREMTAGTPALDDDHPYLLSPRVASGRDEEAYVRFMQVDGPMRRFATSALVRRLWPEALLEPSREAFLAQDAVNAAHFGRNDPAGTGLEELARLLAATRLRAPVLWEAGTSVAEVLTARAAEAAGERLPIVDEILGLDALARRDYREAERRLALAEPHAAHAARIRMWRVLAAASSGDRARAARLLAEAAAWARAPGADPSAWRWLARRYSLPDPTLL